MRRYEVAYLSQSGDILDLNRPAPALPAFEEAFAAIGRGGIVQTELGPRAVEDLLPGDRVLTVENGLQTLRWMGKMTLIPDVEGQAPEMGRLTRIAADSFGLGRPMPDLILGPRARMMYRHPQNTTRLGTDTVFADVRGFIDGENIIEVRPITPVKTYHLSFDGHESVRVNGVEIETYHPGRFNDMNLSLDMLQLFLSLFPHMRRIEDFGPMRHPRLSARDLEQLQAA